MRPPLSPQQIDRLAANVRAKLLSKAALLAEVEGEITIRVFRRGDGFDIKLIVSS